MSTDKTFRTFAQAKQLMAELYGFELSDAEVNQVLEFTFAAHQDEGDTYTVKTKARKFTSQAFIQAIGSEEVVDETIEVFRSFVEGFDTAEDAFAELEEEAPEEEPTDEAPASKEVPEEDGEPWEDILGWVASSRKNYRTKARAWARKYGYEWTISNKVYCLTHEEFPNCYVWFVEKEDSEQGIVEYTEDISEAPLDSTDLPDAAVEETLDEVDALLANA